MKQSVIFLKLGGALITNKDIPNSLRADVLARLAREIAQALKEKETLLVIGNGAGSFAHVPAHKYKTMDGFTREDSRMGMAITQDSAATLNRLVIRSLIKQGIPAVTVAPSSSLVTKNKEAVASFSDVLEGQLRQGLVPVMYGDVIVDSQQGCTIWSTDRVFSFFARSLVAKGWDVSEIIHATEAEGVWKNQNTKEIYPLITPSMKGEVREAMIDIKGTDVTGGMWHKIEESISLAELGIETRIVGGLVTDNVYNVLMGETTIGTRIAA